MPVCKAFFDDHAEDYFDDDRTIKTYDSVKFKRMPTKLNASYYSIDPVEVTKHGPYADVSRSACHGLVGLFQN